MNLKKALYEHCLAYAQERIARIQSEIKRAQTSANEEAKSSAGDKYETGRAMAQLEVEMNTRQLLEAEKLLSIVKSLPTVTSSVAAPGSLITTTNGIFYIAISIGVVKLDQQEFIVISSESPIGRLLLGKNIGDTITWNKQPITIKAIE